MYSVIPRETGCVECWISCVKKSPNVIASTIIDLRKNEDITSRLPAPAISPLIAVATGCMVAEAIKIITKIQPSELSNKFKEFRFDDLATHITETWVKQVDCKVCYM